MGGGYEGGVYVCCGWVGVGGYVCVRVLCVGEGGE